MCQAILPTRPNRSIQIQICSWFIYLFIFGKTRLQLRFIFRILRILLVILFWCSLDTWIWFDIILQCCFSSFQDPLPANRAAAVHIIPSPTSSAWAALPYPWPLRWLSPATPCITAVKAKTTEGPLRLPGPCMTKTSPCHPLLQTFPPATAKSNIPNPVLCWHLSPCRPPHPLLLC